MVEQITLYTAKVCPYAHRVELALEEVGAKYTKYQIDLHDKPEWYASKINPASKVPAIAYGGPAVPADDPSPASAKLSESLVLVEFAADLVPGCALLPADPVLRARARLFVDAVSTTLLPAWVAFFIRGAPGGAEALFSALDAIQALLAPGRTYAVADACTIADVALAPFLARLAVALRHDAGAFAPGEGARAWAVYQTARFARLRAYFEAVKARPSFRATFDEEYVTEATIKLFLSLRAQKNAA